MISQPRGILSISYGAHSIAQVSISYPKTPKPPCFVCVQSFVLRFDLIASDVNQCDSLIGKSRLIDFD